MAYRRSRSNYSRANRDKYSVEQTGISLAVGNTQLNQLYQTSQQIIPQSDIQGMRKVKHLTLSMTSDQTTPMYWALVFVPEGYTVNSLFATTGQLNGPVYNPNQFVMGTGIIDPDAGPIRISSPLSRNLNSGDSIWIVIGTIVANTSFRGICRYAITLQ